MSRTLLYVTYDPYDQIADHVIYQLRALRPFFEKIILIRNLVHPDAENFCPTDLADFIIHRPNIGYDFSAWKDGIEYIHKLAIDFDWLVLMNDSCFGPIFDLRKLFQDLENSDNDFYGITNHKAVKNIPEHIQSYFLGFSKEVFLSSSFKSFWNECVPLDSINEVIKKYEVQLTNKLVKAGFKYKVLIDFKNSQINNISFDYPFEAIKFGSPFVKIKAFLNASQPIFLLRQIETLTEYPIGLIEKYFKINFYPNKNPFLGYDLLVENIRLKKENKNELAIAIHLHIFYIDIFDIFWEHIKNINNIDIYITTDNYHKKSIIDQKIKKDNKLKLYYSIKIIQNRGRDILPWLIAFPELHTKYDVVGHFHTKKAELVNGWIKALWQDEIINSLLKQFAVIYNNFMHYDDLGLVIPEVPIYMYENISGNYWGKNKEVVKNIWEKMDLPKKIDFDALNTPIMPYGTMFWYRPQALRQLFSLNLNEFDFPEEPIPTDGTLVHAIERLPVYLAWANNYGYAISLSKERRVSSFRSLELKWKDINFIQKKMSKKNIKNFVLLFSPPIIINILRSFIRIFKDLKK